MRERARGRRGVQSRNEISTAQTTQRIHPQKGNLEGKKGEDKEELLSVGGPLGAVKWRLSSDSSLENGARSNDRLRNRLKAWRRSMGTLLVATPSSPTRILQVLPSPTAYLLPTFSLFSSSYMETSVFTASSLLILLFEVGNFSRPVDCDKVSIWVLSSIQDSMIYALYWVFCWISGIIQWWCFSSNIVF